MSEHVGASWDAWKAEHGEPLAIEGKLSVWADGSITIDVGDGTLRPLGGVVADYFETRPAGRPLRRPGQPAGRSAGHARPAARLGRSGRRGRDRVAAHAQPRAAAGRAAGHPRGVARFPWLTNAGVRACHVRGEIGQAEDCEVLRRHDLLSRGKD